jgi:hypothetical protein
MQCNALRGGMPNVPPGMKVVFGTQRRVPPAGVRFRDYCRVANDHGYSITVRSLFRGHIMSY